MLRIDLKSITHPVPSHLGQLSRISPRLHPQACPVFGWYPTDFDSVFMFCLSVMPHSLRLLGCLCDSRLLTPETGAGWFGRRAWFCDAFSSGLALPPALDRTCELWPGQSRLYHRAVREIERPNSPAASAIRSSRRATASAYVSRSSTVFPPTVWTDHRRWSVRSVVSSRTTSTVSSDVFILFFGSVVGVHPEPRP